MVAPVVDDAANAVPAVGDVIPIPPQVAVLLDSGVPLRLAGVVEVCRPGAAVDHWAARRVQVASHGRVCCFIVSVRRIASVEFEIISSPAGKRLGVEGEMTHAARIPSAREGPNVLVDCPSDVERMQSRAECSKALRKAHRVTPQLPLGVAAHGQVAVVHVNGFVTNRGEAFRDERLAHREKILSVHAVGWIQRAVRLAS